MAEDDDDDYEDTERISKRNISYVISGRYDKARLYCPQVVMNTITYTVSNVFCSHNV